MAWRGSRVFRLNSKQQTFSNTTGTQGWCWGHRLQQRCGLKGTNKKPDPPSQTRTDPPSSSPEDLIHHHRGRATAPPVAPRSFNNNNTGGFGTLVKPLLFTVAFTGCSFGAAAIWRYESLKRLPRKHEGDLLLPKEVKRRWNGLSEGQRTATGIIAANVLVFCCWRIPSLRPTMLRYFMSSPAGEKACVPMVLSAFSHRSALHLAANMYCLWSFSDTPLVNALGREQFLAVYTSAGAISALASYAGKVATGRRFAPSLGASGAVMTVLAAVCTETPESEMSLIFLPGVAFAAGTALKVALAVDTAGVVLGWRVLDHAAHLGGALFGVWYIARGQELIWKNLQGPFVQTWRELRWGVGGGAN